jgi:transcriptional regulator with XRE-family HTH domain
MRVLQERILTMIQPSKSRSVLAKTIGHRLRQARREAGLTQSRLAEGDLSRSFISQIESGTVVPSLKSLRVLAAKLQLPPAWFLGAQITKVPSPPPFPLSVGEKVKTARLELGMSQRDLAYPHYSRGYVSQIESGSLDPSLECLAILAARLGKPMDWFLDGLLPLEIERPLPAPPRRGAPKYRRSLDKRELELLDAYRQMDEDNQARMLQTAQRLLNSGLNEAPTL